jgi:hypothetical protein
MPANAPTTRYYHFIAATLRDGSPIPPIGAWLTVTGEIIPCENGLHASAHPFNALQFSPGNLLHLVELDGEIIPHNNDKVAARSRKIIATIDAEKLLREFARKCALSVIHLWDAPDVVKRYLETGDESLRAAAQAAAQTAAQTAAQAAARVAAQTAAWAAAQTAARDAAWENYRQMFAEMVNATFKEAADVTC